MAFNKRRFGKSLNDVEMKITSRKGGSNVVSIPQVGEDGRPLNTDAVGVQTLVLESTGKNELKIRGAYHKASPFCAYAPNEPTGEVTEREMPLPWAPISSFDVEDIPAEIKAMERDGKIPNYLYSKVDEATGDVVSEAREVNGRWVKTDIGVPVYRQYFDTKGDPYQPTNKKGEPVAGVAEDEKGFYKETTSPFAYAALVSIGFFNGHAVDEGGNKIANSEGTYMVEGAQDEKYFVKITPLKAGGKVSVGSRLKKVFMNPFLGVVSDDQVSKNGYLMKGKFTYTANPVRFAVYDEDGKVVKVLDRNAFKLSDFHEKKSRKLNTVQTQVEADIAKATNVALAETADDDDDDVI